MTTARQPKATAIERTVRNLLTTTSLLLGLAIASPAAAVQCGDTIGPNQTATLTGFIACDDDKGGVTVIGPATLDMTNSAILCTDDTNQNGIVPTGLVLLGKKAQVRGGFVIGCQNGVRLAGQGRHTVEKVDVQTSREASFQVESDKNTLLQNQGRSDAVGFWVTGHGNILRQNTAEYARFHGFYIEGNNTLLERNSARRNRGQQYAGHGFSLIRSTGHKLTANEATDNDGEGFFVAEAEQVTLRKNRALRNGSAGFWIPGGQGHALTGNEARENSGYGIVVATSETTLTNNVAVGNNQSHTYFIVDLEDRSANCGTNTWKKNTFGTASQPCIQ